MSRKKRPTDKPKSAARTPRKARASTAPKRPDKTRGTAAGIAWPVLQNTQEAYALALQFQLEETQWWSEEKLLAHQLHQIQILIDHAARHVPFYRERYGLAPGALTLERFRRIPLLKRDDIQTAGRDLRSKVLPPGHGTPSPSKTSGSTSQPITFLTTVMTSMMLNALTMRGHIWHQRDLSQKNVSLRPPRPSTPVGEIIRWAPVTHTGPGLLIDMRLPIDDIFEKVAAEDPVYLQSHPYVILGLVQRSEETGIRFEKLREVRTYGETLDPWVRERCEAVWGVPIHDNYSAEEFGTIAHQCPVTTNMHVQAENVLVEVLDANDRQCRRGEVGRVVATSLNNFATPFIRSDIADVTILGEPCECGRGLPVLERVLGKARNFIVRPTGERVFPDLYREFGAIAPVRQFQLVQTSLDVIEMKLVVTRPLTPNEETALKDSINASFGYAFELPITYADDIPRDASGKFRDIRSEVPGAEPA